MGRLTLDLGLSLSAAGGGLNPNLVANGTFDTDLSGWTNVGTAGYDATWDSTNKRMVLRRDGSGLTRAEVTVATVNGHTYNVTCSRNPAETIDLVAGVNTSSGSASTAATSFVAAGATTTIQFRAAGNTAGDFWIDNVAIREA